MLIEYEHYPKTIFFAPQTRLPLNLANPSRDELRLRVRCPIAMEEEEAKNAYVGSECKATLHCSIDQFSIENTSPAPPEPRETDAEASTHLLLLHLHPPSCRRRKHIFSHRNTLQPSTPTPWLGEVAGQTTPRW